jgi:hypothetical protein
MDFRLHVPLEKMKFYCAIVNTALCGSNFHPNADVQGKKMTGRPAGMVERWDPAPGRAVSRILSMEGRTTNGEARLDWLLSVQARVDYPSSDACAAQGQKSLFLVNMSFICYCRCDKRMLSVSIVSQ